MLLLLLSLALAETPVSEGTLILDAKVPSEVLIDGHTIAQMFVPGVLTVQVITGPHELKVYNNGSPVILPIEMNEGVTSRVVIGRTGLSAEGRTATHEPEADTNVSLQVRVTGSERVRLFIDDERYQISAGENLQLDVAPGKHRVSIRNGAGTVIWASGVLKLTGPDEVVLQLTEGRMPEVSGQGAFSSQAG